MDGEKEVDGENKSESKQSPSDDVKKTQVSSQSTDEQSPQKPQLSPEQEKWVEKLVQDRYTAKLARDGDKAKTLEDKLEKQSQFIEELQKERLTESARKYGLSIEQLNEAGITDPKQVEKFANLFSGKEVEPSKEAVKTQKVDPGTTSGGGKLSWEAVQSMSPKEFKKLKEEHGATEILDLIDKGVVAQPK